jgi:hypothetical protein
LLEEYGNTNERTEAYGNDKRRSSKTGRLSREAMRDGRVGVVCFDKTREAGLAILFLLFGNYTTTKPCVQALRRGYAAAMLRSPSQRTIWF